MICRKLLKGNSFFYYFLFAVCDLFESDYQFLAASIAYYTLMSIIPLFIFLFFITVTFFHVNFESFLPHEIVNSPLNPIVLQIQELINNSKIISGTAAVVMLWFSRGIFLSIERSFSEILKLSNPRGFIYRHFATTFIVFLIWFLMFLFYIFKYILLILIVKLPFVLEISSIVPPIMLFSFLFFLYYFLLPVPVSFSFNFKITLTIFILLVIFERTFIWFVTNVSKVSILYGSFAAIVVFLLWIYYSATVLLLGAGIVKAKLLLEGKDGSAG